MAHQNTRAVANPRPTLCRNDHLAMMDPILCFLWARSSKSRLQVKTAHDVIMKAEPIKTGTVVGLGYVE
jgi:hypothetical protein